MLINLNRHLSKLLYSIRARIIEDLDDGSSIKNDTKSLRGSLKVKIVKQGEGYITGNRYALYLKYNNTGKKGSFLSYHVDSAINRTLDKVVENIADDIVRNVGI